MSSPVLKTSRDLRIFSAGQMAGMRNFAMVMAATKSRPRAERASFVKQAREFHHTYLARLREANGAPGYYVPMLETVPVVQPIRLTLRQAS